MTAMFVGEKQLANAPHEGVRTGQEGTPHEGVRTGPDGVQAEALRRVEAYLRGEQARRTLHGAAGRIVRVSEQGGGEFGYEYDANGDLVAIREANGRERRYGYEERRRLARVEHGDGGVTRYTYDAADRLASRDDRGVTSRYTYDAACRVATVQHGQADVCVYRYDGAGRVQLARTAHVTTRWEYGADGRAAVIEQSLGGVTLRAALQYDAAGRLVALTLPGSDQPLTYAWDERGRPQAVGVGDDALVRFAYDDAARTTTVEHANGVTATSTAQPVDGRALRLALMRGERRLWARRIEYGDTGEIVADGERAYQYDGLGRLTRAANLPPNRVVRTPRAGYATTADVAEMHAAYRYTYDPLDNLLAAGGPDGDARFTCDAAGRLLHATDGAGARTEFAYDRWGRLVQKRGPGGAWEYCYDDGGLLHEVRCNGLPVARFLYDHKGRLACADEGGQVERYLYGDADELLAVTDGKGRPKRLLVRTPLGVHAEVHGALGAGEVFFRHADERGTLRLVTDAAGEVCARFEYDPFGQPRHATSVTYKSVTPSPAHPLTSSPRHPLIPSSYTARDYHPAAGLYYFGARWYDPALRRFLTPDSYTGAPDDLRLVNPLHAGGEQAALRGQILGEWLKQPRVRNPWAFCANDPVGRVDPNGHWSFGGVVLMLLGAIWTLPNTLLGILIEITCLVGEVLRWLVWLVSFGNVSWQTPGFDAAASGRLNAFALVFSGGWLGSFSGLLGITFGNVFFVYKEWEQSPYIAALPDPIFPPAYGGRVSIPRQRMLYEHELRHTNQYGWFGPFYHFGLPLFGFYEWDVIVNGYRGAWTERDARAHAEP